MKSVVGKVISAKMKDTVVVEMSILVPHPAYSKLVRRTSKYHVHNGVGAKMGDTVKIVEIRPMSKTKNWKVEEVT